jgi:predicted Zn finger-like uncharacterized protein
MIAFSCPKCKAAFKTTDDKAGLQRKCPKCGSVVQVPSNDLDDEMDLDDGPAKMPHGTKIAIISVGIGVLVIVLVGIMVLIKAKEREQALDRSAPRQHLSSGSRGTKPSVGPAGDSSDSLRTMKLCRTQELTDYYAYLVSRPPGTLVKAKVVRVRARWTHIFVQDNAPWLLCISIQGAEFGDFWGVMNEHSQESRRLGEILGDDNAWHEVTVELGPPPREASMPIIGKTFTVLKVEK